MAKKIKKQEVAEKSMRVHADCSLCRPITDKHLDYQRNPLLGRCQYSEYWFLLQEKVKCDNFKKR